MKSKRRHELQQNTLDAELGKIVGWLKTHATKLALAALIVAVVILGVTLYKRQTRTALAEVQAQYEKLRNAQINPQDDNTDVVNGLRSLSKQEIVPWIAADALVRIGNIHLSKMTLAELPEERESLAAEASQAYQEVLTNWSDQFGAVGAAHVGLARVAEGKGDYAAARQHYEKVVENPSLEGFPIVDIARKSLREISGWEQPVKLAASLPVWAQEGGEAGNADQEEDVQTPADPADEEAPEDEEQTPPTDAASDEADADGAPDAN